MKVSKHAKILSGMLHRLSLDLKEEKSGTMTVKLNKVDRYGHTFCIRITYLAIERISFYIDRIINGLKHLGALHLAGPITANKLYKKKTCNSNICIHDFRTLYITLSVGVTLYDKLTTFYKYETNNQYLPPDKLLNIFEREYKR